MHKKIFLFLLVALTLIPSVSGSIIWVNNSNQLTKGLADITSACQCWVDPTIFYKDGVWTAIASGGDNPSEYFGYTWDGTQWVSNPSVITGLPSLDHYISPSVFQINGKWVLVRGRWGDTGIPEGYVWNGASWVVDSSFSSGLSPLSEGKPTIFKMTSGEYVLIMEHAHSGTYTGYTWTGSSWSNNPSLVSGLENLDTYTHPAAFVKDNENLLIISKPDGTFLGFKWNGIKWISDSSQVTGLGNIGSYAMHTVFQKDGKWILIGTRDLAVNYFGFESTVATPTATTPFPTTPAPIATNIASTPLQTQANMETPNPTKIPIATEPQVTSTLLKSETNWTLLGGAIFVILLIGAVILRSRKSKESTSKSFETSKLSPNPDIKDLEITRDYEILENKDMRFGILVTNRSNYTVNDVDVHLKYDRSLFSLKGKEVISLGNITKNNPKTATYFLAPLVGCVHNSKISAIVSYKDASDNSLTVQMRPKEVHCISPFLAEKPMTEEQFSELNESHICHDKGIVFKGISPEALTNFIVDSAKNKRYVVKNSFINGIHIIYLSSVAKDKTFYLITVVIRSENSLTHVGLRACSNNEGGINNFINEILTSLRHYVNSVQSAREVENVTNNILLQIIKSDVHGGVSIGGDAFGRDESFNQELRR